MIESLRVVRFKRFDEETINLSGQPVILAGPNNSGKTTVLHAIAAWALALRRWRLESGDKTRRKRIGILLDEFTALPLREMNLLWLNRHVARKVPDAKTPKAAPIFIEATVSLPTGLKQSLTMEFLYANEKLVYVRPVTSPDNPAPLPKLPSFVDDFQVVHVPPFSGIGTQEPRHSVGIQNKLIGEGRAGEIVRNLVLDIWEASSRDQHSSPWKLLTDDLNVLFQCDLLPPQFSEAQPYIVVEYRPPLRAGQRSGPRLDVANAGSGFHQVLLLLAFFYARPSSVLLLDEPDAHLHFILQGEIFDLLKRVAKERNCKLIVATHAEVLLSGSDPEQIVSFVGPTPQRLIGPHQKTALAAALKTLRSLDLLRASHVGAILYVENDSDYKLLREWARILDHLATSFLLFPYVCPLEGRGNLGHAKKHFACLRLAHPEIRGLCLVDRDVAGPEMQDFPPGLEGIAWGRYEIENYLLNPSVLTRYVDRPLNLFNAESLVSDRTTIEEAFAKTFPANLDWLSDARVLRELKGSDFIVDTLALTSQPLAKRDLYILAAKSLPEEIHPDVVAVLNRILAMLPAHPPALAANEAPADLDGTAEEPAASDDE